MQDVVLRVSDKFSYRMHIDFDEANAADVRGFTLGQILKQGPSNDGPEKGERLHGEGGGLRKRCFKPAGKTQGRPRSRHRLHRHRRARRKRRPRGL
ncbi:MAG: PduL/EutD family phosphate acyltransferase [Cloacibacillus evryensis]